MTTLTFYKIVCFEDVSPEKKVTHISSKVSKEISITSQTSVLQNWLQSETTQN